MISVASIRSRLFNIAQKEKIAFQVVATRYLHERFLYRLSVSEYASCFYLKGGNFIYALQEQEYQIVGRSSPFFGSPSGTIPAGSK